MKNYGFWIGIFILIWVVSVQRSEVNKLSGLLTDLNKLNTDQSEVIDMSRDYIKLNCRK